MYQQDCQCEHITHFYDEIEQDPTDVHLYGQVPATVTVRTDYGTFSVCQTCADTCLKEYDLDKKGN